MKAIKTKYDDGLDWLREIRRKIWDDCGHDLKKLEALHREAYGREVERRKQAAALHDKRNEK
jgi:hypothetical protein